jgi:hypothetical protein
MPVCTSGTKTAGTQLINSLSVKLIQESQGGESYKSKNPFDAYLEAPSDTFSAGLYVKSLPVRSGNCTRVCTAYTWTKKPRDRDDHDA